jgi:hypothetical protein
MTLRWQTGFALLTLVLGSIQPLGAEEPTPQHKAAAAVMVEDSRKAKLLKEIRLDFTAAGDPVEALDSGREIVVVEATPASLSALAAAKDRVDAFTRAGGWLMLWGVTPAGLADFNQLVGVDHVLRPFLRERLVLADPPDPLTAGLSPRDVAMDTGVAPQKYEKDVPWVVSDACSYIVDLEDIAPFMDFRGRESWIKRAKEGPQNAGNPLSMFNGFTSDRFWKWIYYIPFEGESAELRFTLPRQETLRRLHVVPNNHLWQARTIEVYADDAAKPLRLPLELGATRQSFDLGGISAEKLRLVLTDLENVNPKRPQKMTGIENLSITADRSAEWKARVRPLLNIGGLVAYSMGKGGILLNQLDILEREENPVNLVKKQVIVQTLLRNLGASVTGTPLTESPVFPAWQHLYVGDWSGGIYRIAADGTAKLYADIGRAQCFTFDKSGTLYTAAGGEGGGILKITPTEDGSPATRENGHIQLIHPGVICSSVTLDGEGNLWCGIYPGKRQGKIFKLSPDGTKTIIDRFKGAYSLTNGPEGNVYRARLHPETLFKYTPAGEETVLSKDIVWLRGAAVDPEGRVYGFGGEEICRVDPDGQTRLFYNTKWGETPGRHGVGIVCDANGTVYTSSMRSAPLDGKGGYIFKYAPYGRKRDLFCRLGRRPAYMAFYPKAPDSGAKETTE